MLSFDGQDNGSEGWRPLKGLYAQTLAEDNIYLDVTVWEMHWCGHSFSSKQRTL